MIIYPLSNHNRYGEKGHFEYDWTDESSFNIGSGLKEIICQFNFQLVRSNDNNIEHIADKLHSLLSLLFERLNTREIKDVINDKIEAIYYLSILYKLIGYTRDIIDGKGEYKLTYMMIYEWYKFSPELSKYALETLVNGKLLQTNYGSLSVAPYGSWKDIKKFCQYCYDKTKQTNDPYISYCIDLINNQLKKDYINYVNSQPDISLAAKWVPRENSKYEWLFDLLAMDYFSNYMKTTTTENSKADALLKCRTHYRKLLTKLNKQLDTLEIKQCQQKWSIIDFNHVTSISLMKQKKAFLFKNKYNRKSKNMVDKVDTVDREKCVDNFHNFLATKGYNCKGKRVSIVDFVKNAFRLFNNQNADNADKDDKDDNAEKTVINSQWRDNGKINNKFNFINYKKMIPMIDVGDSMIGDALYAAIGLGIRISEKSLFANRLLTFSATPTWINLSPFGDDFVQKVQHIMKPTFDTGMRTDANFQDALMVILNAIIENKMTSEETADMVLVILSDMQINATVSSSVYSVIHDAYANAGLTICGKPYKPPHILFWNLRNTSGFPSLSNEENTTMLSGFSPAILNSFVSYGTSSAALKQATPWDRLEKILQNKRYQNMENKLKKYFDLLM